MSYVIFPPVCYKLLIVYVDLGLANTYHAAVICGCTAQKQAWRSMRK